VKAQSNLRGLKGSEQVPGGICRTIIHDNDLPFHGEPDASDPVKEGPYRSFFIIDRDNHGKFHQRIL